HVEQELNEEIQYHFERQIDARLKAGLEPDEARYAALRTMGAIEKSKEECRDLRSANLVGEFVADLRYAGRAFRRSPGFAVLTIGIMALGIGANTAVFSVVNGVLLKPLPYSGADRIVTLRTSFLTRGESQTLVSIANFRDWRDQSSSFEAMSSYRPGENSVTTGDTAEYGRIASVDGHFFRVFAVEPIIGRMLTPEEIGPDAPPEVPVSFTTMEAKASEGVQDPRFRALLFGLFAALAVCLAMAGVYGVMAFAVEQRSKEIGLRMALGADKTSVLRLILGQGFVLAATGLVLGLGGAVAATRLLETVLFQVRPIDLEVYLGVIALVGIVTVLAGYLPAWRAAVVNPLDVLKAE
ncbi:MAG: FtsX-like permease family protein, partial [Vicinamibacterales bacterium]